MNTIAKLDLPKQRATAQLSVVLCYDPQKNLYSTHEVNFASELQEYRNSKYHLYSFEEAFEDFKSRCQKWLSYSPSVYELNQKIF